MTVAQEVLRMMSPVTSPGKNIATACAEMVPAIAGYSIPRAVIASGQAVIVNIIAK